MGPKLPNLGASAALNPKRLEKGWLLALRGRGWENEANAFATPYNDLQSLKRPHPPFFNVGGGAASTLDSPLRLDRDALNSNMRC